MKDQRPRRVCCVVLNPWGRGRKSGRGARKWRRCEGWNVGLA